MSTVLLYVILVTSGSMATVTTTSQTLLPAGQCEIAKKKLLGLNLPSVLVIPMCIGETK